MTDDHLQQNKSGRKESQIPVFRKSRDLNRTGSLKLRNEGRPRFSLTDKSDVTPNSSPPKLNLRRHRSLQALEKAQFLVTDTSYEHDDDDSEKSLNSSCNSVYGGNGSRHSPFAHNGTTYSARSMRYIYHCSSNAGSEEYLTPTQRANKTIKRLRQMLADAQSELIERESEIARLTREIVELRLLKADNCDEEGYRSRVISGDLEDIDEAMMEPIINKNNGNSIISGNTTNNNARFMDVLHEENDVANHADIIEQQSTNISTDNRGPSPHHAHTSPSLADSGNFEDMNYTLFHNVEKDYEKLRRMYEQAKDEHNEKVAQLLNVIEAANDRYYTLKPKHDEAELRIKELEKENEALKEKLLQQDELQKVLLEKVCKQNEDSNSSSYSRLDDDTVDSAKNSASSCPSYNMTSLLNQLAHTRSELEKIKFNERSARVSWIRHLPLPLQPFKVSRFVFVSSLVFGVVLGNIIISCYNCN